MHSQSFPSLVLSAAYLLSQLSAASAAGCSNFTYLSAAMNGPDGSSPEFEQAIDFLSCPPSSKSDCQLTPKTYTITVQPQINISSTNNYSTNQDSNSVFNSGSDSTDATALFSSATQLWPSHQLNTTINASITTTVSTMNLSQTYGSNFLTVTKGTNYTLKYHPYTSYMYALVDGCQNQSINGSLVDVIMPYYNANSQVLAGKFVSDVVAINTTTKSAASSGTGMSFGAMMAWMGGVLVMSLVL
jgi:hypothetical protein